MVCSSSLELCWPGCLPWEGRHVPTGHAGGMGTQEWIANVAGAVVGEAAPGPGWGTHVLRHRSLLLFISSASLLFEVFWPTLTSSFLYSAGNLREYPRPVKDHVPVTSHQKYGCRWGGTAWMRDGGRGSGRRQSVAYCRHCLALLQAVWELLCGEWECSPWKMTYPE